MLNIEFNIWVVYLAGIYLMSISGTTYMFPAYSQDVKLYFNYSSEQTNFIGTMGNIGTWAGVIGGLFFDRFGPRRTAVGGSLMIFMGYFGLFLCSIYVLPTYNWLVGIFAFVAGQGSCWTYFSALNPSTKNFESKHRGKIVGSLVCFFGLCSAIYTRFYSLFSSEDGNDLPGFFLFLSIILSSVGVIGGMLSNYVTTEYKGHVSKRIIIVYILSIVFALYLSGSSIFAHLLVELHVGSVWLNLLAVIASIFYASFMLITIKTGSLCYPISSTKTTDTLIEDKYEDGEVKVDTTPTPTKSLLDALKCPEMYLLYFIQTSVIGSGIMILNNLSAIVISKANLTTDEHIASVEDIYMYSALPTFVIMFAACNTFGRMLFGTLSDLFLKKFNRGVWYIVCASMMTFSQIFFMYSTIPMIYVGIAVLGLCYGGSFSLAPTITSELFGMPSFGANWGFLQTAGALGSQLINVLLAGKLADYFEKDGRVCILRNGQCNWQCLGFQCYHYTFMITSGLCALAIIASIILTIRMRPKHAPFEKIH